MPLAYSYIRYSTLKQSDGHSTQRQIDSFNRACQIHGLTPANDTFQDLGRSGWKRKANDDGQLVKSKEQKELARFFQLVENNVIPSGSWLVLDAMSRLGRIERWEIEGLLRYLVKKGITVCMGSLIVDKKTIKDLSVTMQIFIAAEMAAKESDEKSRMVGASWRNKLANASKDKPITARGPLWLTPKLNGEGENAEVVGWTVDREKAAVLKRIFKLCVVEGHGTRQIAKILNTDKVPTFQGDGLWWNQTIRRYILDGRVTGVFTYNRREGKRLIPVKEVPDYFPRVIDDRTFRKAVAAIKQRSHFKGRSERITGLFTGLAYDIVTGTRMMIDRKSRNHVYWTSAKRFNTEGNNGGAFPYPVFEQEFLKLTNELTIKDIGVDCTSYDEEIDELEAQRADLQTKISKLNKSIESGSLENFDNLIEMSGRLEGELKNVSQRLEVAYGSKHADKPEEALVRSQDVSEALKNAKDDERIAIRAQLRQSIRQLVRRIDCKIVKRKALIDIYAMIYFASGYRQMLFVRSRLGKPAITIYDTEKWLGKPKLNSKYIVFHDGYDGGGFSEAFVKSHGLTMKAFLGFDPPSFERE